jgi:hypothetical protein
MVERGRRLCELQCHIRKAYVPLCVEKNRYKTRINELTTQYVL